MNSAAAVQGFRAMLPFSLAGAPVALAYVLAARSAGIADVEIQLMSLTMFSSASQIALVQLWSGGASVLAILSTILVMNLHFIIYGVSLAKHIRLRGWQKVIAAYSLTDAAYGLVIATPKTHSLSYLLGAECCMFLSWNLFTAAALLVGDLFAVLRDVPLDFIVPLTFFVLLVKMTQTRTDLAVVMFSAALAILCMQLGLGQITVILVSIGGPLFGLGIGQLWETGHTTPSEVER